MRKLKEPAKLTPMEKNKLSKSIWLKDWHFNLLIKRHCTEISSHLICWDNDKAHYAFIWGLNAVKTNTNDPCIANLFVRYDFRLYQFHSISDACKMIEMLKKEHEYDEYEEKMYLQESERKKNAKERSSKSKNVKTLKANSKEDVAA
ncbi:hypothetical protein SAMN05421788_102366 [Filimonas lacunae]|uniref:Uncharacterized protein n=1 Tax=Filimonas lacunae TaxID=477680 RepID=A0A1N7NEA1_9BACT|nr:hypothetical protein [Filimonas lacunae]SIS96509.1 hypothetical protein SAMN05421788_102366 [Filimonas lacunae]